MANEKNMAASAAYAPWDLRKIPDFDLMEFVRTVEQAGKKTLLLSLEGKKTWFRLACPTGGLVLNPLRVTDQMAIFEARVFADGADPNPLASFTATRSAEKATGKQYIRSAQDEALNEALESAGFSLRIWSMSPRGVTKEPVTDANNATNAGEPMPTPPVESKTPPVAAIQQAVAEEKPAQGNAQPAPKFKTVTETAPRPAPVGPPPHAPGVLRSSAGGAQTHSDAGSKPANAPVVDISTAKPAEKAQPAAQQVQTGGTKQPEPHTEPTQGTLPPTGDETPVTYTAEMTVEEICERMTLEQAKKVKVLDGTCKGWTLEQVATDRPPSLKWLRYTAPSADNVVKAAAAIMLKNLELRQAG